MASIFSKIVSGEIPCYQIAENEHCFAFLDINPLAEGHTLVVPKIEVDHIFDLDDEQYIQLFSFARMVGKAIGNAIPCTRVGMTVIGLEVPHAHIHLIPIRSIFDMEFSRPKLKLSADDFERIATSIRKEVG